jgi:hypothetical protein
MFMELVLLPYCTSRTANVTILMFDCTEFYTLVKGVMAIMEAVALEAMVSTIMTLLRLLTLSSEQQIQ